MNRNGLNPKQLQVLRLVDNIAGRFEAEAGFPLPCVSVGDLATDYAARFGISHVVEEDLDRLAGAGLLHVRMDLRDGKRYALTAEGMRLARAIGAKAA